MALGGIWLSNAFRLDVIASYGGIGPGLFVGLVGVGLVLLGIVLMIQIRRGERFDPQATEDMTPDAPVSRRGLLLTVTASAVPLATMQQVGFPVTAALVFALVARAFGTHRIVHDWPDPRPNGGDTVAPRPVDQPGRSHHPCFDADLRDTAGDIGPRPDPAGRTALVLTEDSHLMTL
jgi:putative tricarboxylic transport membrane protein